MNNNNANACFDIISEATHEEPINLFNDGHRNILAARWRHRNCWIPVHNSGQYILCYHESGTEDIRRFERGKLTDQTSRPNTITFIPCDGTEWEISGECEVLHLYLDNKLLNQFILEFSSRNANITPFFSVSDPWIENYCKTLLAECALYGPAVESLLLKQSQSALVTHLFRQYSADRTHTIASFTQEQNLSIPRHRLKKVLDFIEEHYAQEITLKELADIACVSEFHFARNFKSSVGISPHQYLIKKRLQAASLLLARHDASIQVVAKESGFNSTQHFSTSFKRWSGKTPREYRNNVR